MRTWRRWGGLGGAAVLLSVVGLAAAGCGGSEDAGAVASLEPTTAADDGSSAAPASSDPQDVILEYTQCLRDQGFDVPDPDLSAGPGGGGPAGQDDLLREAGIDPDDPAFLAAQDECQPILEGIQQQFDDSFRSELEDAALEYAKCMRSEGFDMPDPDFSAGPGAGGAGPFGDIDVNDPAFQAANAECEHVLAEILGQLGGGS